MSTKHNHLTLLIVLWFVFSIAIGIVLAKAMGQMSQFNLSDSEISLLAVFLPLMFFRCIKKVVSLWKRHRFLKQVTR